MIKVKINDTEYEVNWQYNHEYVEEIVVVKVGLESLKVSYMKPIKVTTCTLNSDGESLIEAFSVHEISNKPFIKEEHRKKSLEKALREISFSKEEREIFWNTYHARKPNNLDAVFGKANQQLFS